MTYSFAAFAALLPTIAFAAIGPVADLHIVNKQIAPDGFSREYVRLSDVRFHRNADVVAFQHHPSRWNLPGAFDQG